MIVEGGKLLGGKERNDCWIELGRVVVVGRRGSGVMGLVRLFLLCKRSTGSMQRISMSLLRQFCHHGQIA